MFNAFIYSHNTIHGTVCYENFKHIIGTKKLFSF